MGVDKLVDSTQLDSDLTSVANAIRTKGGTAASLAFPSGFVTAINAIPTGGGGGDEPDPTDGKTHIWIYIGPDTHVNKLNFQLYFGQSKANGVTVDWGDGGATETFADTGETVHEHTYTTGGDYEITLDVTDGTLNLTGLSGSPGFAIYGSKGNPNTYNRSRIKRVHIGDGVTSIGEYCFNNCYALKKVSGMGNVASIGGYAFYCCHSLTNAMIPDGVTSIGTYAFSSCYSVTSITIPDSVTSIENGAFASCYGMAEYHLLPTTPPTITNANVFNNIPSDCIIYVPAESLEAYKTASYWSTYADKMQGE